MTWPRSRHLGRSGTDREGAAPHAFGEVEKVQQLLATVIGNCEEIAVLDPGRSVHASVRTEGVDAVEKMAERVPDLVLLDIEMPRMDGYEVAQNMKSDPRLKDVPIIMITSRTGEKHRQRAFEIGVQRYLGKPYQEHELLRNVFELLEQEQPDREPA